MDPAIKTALLSAMIGAVVGIAADRIRARGAGQWWEAQERWKLRRDIYLRLLENLWELLDASRRHATIQTIESPETHPGYSSRLASQVQRITQAFDGLGKGRGSLSLLIDPETLKALDGLDAADAIGCPAPYLAALQKAYDDVLATAQKDLRLRLE